MEQWATKGNKENATKKNTGISTLSEISVCNFPLHCMTENRNAVINNQIYSQKARKRLNHHLSATHYTMNYTTIWVSSTSKNASHLKQAFNGLLCFSSFPFFFCKFLFHYFYFIWLRVKKSLCKFCHPLIQQRFIITPHTLKFRFKFKFTFVWLSDLCTDLLQFLKRNTLC